MTKCAQPHETDLPRKEVPKRFPKLKKWHGGESLDISRPTPQGGGETICETHLEVPCLFLGALPLGMRPEEAPLPHAPPPGAKFLPSTCSSHCQIGAAPSAPQLTRTHPTPTHLQNHAATNTSPGTFKWVSPIASPQPCGIGVPGWDFFWGGRFLFTTAQPGGPPFQKPNNSSHQNPIILAGQACSALSGDNL